MKYLVFVIYGMVIGQLIYSKPVIKSNGARRGRHFYKVSSIVNFIIGFTGINVVNMFLRDKGIIPQFFVWCALVGFALMVVYAFYCVYKMLVSTEP